MDIVYHANCLDGFFSAYYLRRVIGKCNTLAMRYEDYDLSLLNGNESLYIVDFSFPPEVLTKLAEQYKRIFVYDHHKTAISRLQGYKHPNVNLYLDERYSGVGLIRLHYYNEVVTTGLAKYIQDYDLWKFEYGETTREVNAGLWAMGFDFDKYYSLSEVINVGKGVRFRDKQLVDVLFEDVSPWSKDGITFGIIETECRWITNDLAEKIYKNGYDVAVIISNNKVSLRSAVVNVRKIAEKFGGGGHDLSAGMPIGGWHEFIVEI